MIPEDNESSKDSGSTRDVIREAINFELDHDEKTKKKPNEYEIKPVEMKKKKWKKPKSYTELEEDI